MLRTPVAGCLIAVAICLAVAGCAGDNNGSSEQPRTSPSPSPSTSESVAPSEIETTTPEPSAPPLPDPVDSRAGRKVFAEHVLAVWSYAIGSNDATPLVALSPKKSPCDGCPQLQTELDRRSAEGWFVDFPGARVTSAEVSGNRAASVARLAISIPESQAFNADGSFRSSSPAHPDATFEVRMRLVRGDYQLLSFTVTT